MSFDPWVRKIPWSQKWHLAPIFLPGKFHGQRSVTGDSPWDCKELDMTEWLSIYITVWEQLIHGFSSVVSTQYSKTFRFLLKLLLGSLDPPAISQAQSYFSPAELPISATLWPWGISLCPPPFPLSTPGDILLRPLSYTHSLGWLCPRTCAQSTHSPSHCHPSLCSVEPAAHPGTASPTKYSANCWLFG